MSNSSQSGNFRGKIHIISTASKRFPSHEFVTASDDRAVLAASNDVLDFETVLRRLSRLSRMFESGAYVADHITPIEESQVQPNGVDLTLASVLEQTEPGQISTDDKRVGDRSPIEFESRNGREWVSLSPGGYVLQYAETVHIPEGHIGFIYPRSSLMRNSCMLNTAVWDAGYEGKGEGLLQVHHPIDLERGARIAQIVLAEASHEDTYDGSYQGERTE